MNNQNNIINKTLSKKRTANFRDDETRLLIKLWGSPVIQNKLSLTHRKAPVMRLLAASMQQRGFDRTPDEIKTRIRNLKCLYHRIKRTITSGSGIGTVDPDWPHYKAMDSILGDSKNSNAQNKVYQIHNLSRNENGLEGPKCVDIKQEIDMDIKDDLDSWAGNDSNMESEYDDDMAPVSMPEPAITITTPITTSNSQTMRTNSAPQTVQTSGLVTNGLPPSIPLPLLILNSLKPNLTAQALQSKDGQPPNKKTKDSSDESGVTKVLSQLVSIQKEHLDVEKERLEVEKQRLEFDRVVGSQLMTLVPMIGNLIHRLVFPQNQGIQNLIQIPEEESVAAETETSSDELEKNRNILRNLLDQGIKARLKESEKERAKDEENTQTNKNSEVTEVPNDNPSDDSESCVLLINENSNGSVENN